MSDERLAARAAKLKRLQTDPRFAIENLYSVWDLENSRMVPFRYNEAQVMLDEEIKWFRSRRLPVRLWILKSRRAGISTGVEGNIFHDTTFNENRISLILANHSKPAYNVFKMCVSFWKSTPEEWRPKLPKKYNQNPPIDRFEFEEINSYLYIATARSLEQYLGYGFSNLHATEVARYAEGEEIFISLFPALVKSEASMFFGESTPRGQGNFFHEQCMEAYQSQGRTAGQYGAFRLLFIPWWKLKKSYSVPFVDKDGRQDPEARVRFERSLRGEEKDLLARYPIDLEQLKWRRSMLSGPPFNKHPDIFDQEFPTDIETAFLSSGSSVFARSDLKRLLASKRQPKWAGDVYWGDNDVANSIENDHDLVRHPLVLTKGEARAKGFKAHSFIVDNNYPVPHYNNLRVYRWPKKGDRIAIGADVAEGSPETKNGDDSTVAVVCYHDFGPHELLMVWQGKCDTIVFAQICSALAWYVRSRVGDDPPPLLAIEWTGPGVTTNTYLDNKNLYAPTFRYFNPGVHKQPKTHHIGWESNYRNKKLWVNFLQHLVAKDEIELPDQQTILQMTAFRQFGAGGEEEWGGEGMHDDLVCSLGIAVALIKLGRVATSGSAVIDMERAAAELNSELDAFDPEESRIISGLGGILDVSEMDGFRDEREDVEEVLW